MPKLDRKDIKIFAENDTNNEIVQFGSTRTGSINPSTDPDVLQALASYGLGWSQGVIASSGVPPFEEFNTLQYLASREQAYIQQAGIPEYSATTTYYAGKSIAREPEGTKIYLSLTDDNVGNALTDVVNWQLLGDLANLVQATETSLGTAEIATQAETDAGLDDTKIVTPTKLANSIFAATPASQAEVDAGVVTDKYVAPSTLLGLFGLSTNGNDSVSIIPVNIGGAFEEVIIQRGTDLMVGVDNATFNFPIAFPNELFMVVATVNNTKGVNSSRILHTSNATNTLSTFDMTDSSGAIGTSFNWIAIGR